MRDINGIEVEIGSIVAFPNNGYSLDKAIVLQFKDNGVKLSCNIRVGHYTTNWRKGVYSTYVKTFNVNEINQHNSYHYFPLRECVVIGEVDVDLVLKEYKSRQKLCKEESLKYGEHK